ncbi:ATP-binding protein [Aquimarina sp. ERC-38]|uniref:ATP-binding protein n=1 Tax=Aquimarina sp. ERC-38 TaxID=2949996 RepID=UPI002246961E|nr:ATP-binding protein [Aquimarina sp. ERC-38]UZO82420.1 ATP-binding protein [Aquimarina sp. ERC-38]
MSIPGISAQRALLKGEIEQVVDSILLHNKGRIYDDDISEVINNNNKVLILVENLPNPQKERYQAEAYNLQGIVYYQLEEMEKAVDFFNKTAAIAEKNKDSLLAARALGNIAIIRIDSYKDLTGAIKNYKQALTLLRPVDSIAENRVQLNMAWAYAKNKQYAEAKNILNLCEEFTFAYGNPQERTYFYHIDGQYYHSIDSLDLAADAYQEAIRLGKEHDVDAVPDIYKDYAFTLRALGKPEATIANLLTYADLKDQEFQNMQKAQNEIANSRFEVAHFQREKRYAESRMNRSRILSKIAIGSLAVLVVFLFTLWYLNRKNIKLASLLSVQNDQLQLTNDKYEKALKQKSQFINTVSHELRTPLYGVVGITSLLLNSKNLDEQQSEYLNSLKFSGDYLLNLINDILLMSKIEVSKIEPIIESFNLKELSISIVKSFDNLTDEANNQIEYHIDPDIPTIVSGDRLRLSQILINLIGNANKFTAGGLIQLKLSCTKYTSTDIQILFEVIDNGIGIPEDKQEDIFESFSQVDAKESAFKGTGLGLPIIKKLIEFYGGTIAVESELGKGSRFWFELTFKTVKEDIKQTEQTQNSDFDIVNKKILVAEDNKINQLVTKKTLENFGFICDLADNGQIAIDMFQNKTYDAILMDLHMPVMNGIEAIKQIRKSDTSIPIVLLTASEMKQDDPLLQNVAINEILIKPYATQHFFNVILNVLRK